MASDIYYPDDDLYAVVGMLSDEDKRKLFNVTNKCFEIIGPDEDEDEEDNGNEEDIDVLMEPSIRLGSDKDKFEKNISIYQQSQSSTLPKRTHRMTLKPFQKQRLEEQSKLVKSLMEAMKEVPSGLEIWHIQNDDGFTLLHQAAFKDQAVVMRKLLKIARERVQEVEVYKNKPIIS